MDLTNTAIVIDSWEANLEIDEGKLRENGVAGIIPRLNSLSKELRLDLKFKKQWDESAAFERSLYYVHSPYYKPRDQFNFLCDHVPGDLIGARIMIDKELQNPTISPAQETPAFYDFLGMVKERWEIALYTGHWFIPQLTSWPTQEEYWWARYPGYLYPATSEIISWDALKKRLAAVLWNPGPVPGPCRLWQCTADRYKLPGFQGRAVDVNVFKGTRAELHAWLHPNEPMPKPEPEFSDTEKLGALWEAHPELHAAR
jgi:GH25 family lysozyme M1 (1,4-beta-N-acetylmuramidase)